MACVAARAQTAITKVILNTAEPTTPDTPISPWKENEITLRLKAVDEIIQFPLSADILSPVKKDFW